MIGLDSKAFKKEPTDLEMVPFSSIYLAAWVEDSEGYLVEWEEEGEDLDEERILSIN